MRSALEQSRRLVLPELTARACRARPDRPAVVFGDEVRTHAEIHARAGRLATVLAAHGVRAGDRVALLLHNRIEFVETLLACHRLAAIAVPAGVRAEICTIADPSLIRSVREPHHASGISASDP